jgi:hypothetical protein
VKGIKAKHSAVDSSHDFILVAKVVPIEREFSHARLNHLGRHLYILRLVVGLSNALYRHRTAISR